MSLNVPGFIPSQQLKVPGSIIWLREKQTGPNRYSWVRVGEQPDRVVMETEVIRGEPTRKQTVLLCGQPAEFELEATIVQLKDSVAPVWTEWRVCDGPKWLDPNRQNTAPPAPILDPDQWSVVGCSCAGDPCRTLREDKPVDGVKRLWYDSAGVVRASCVPTDLTPAQGEPNCRRGEETISPHMPEGTYRILVERSCVSRNGRFRRFEWVVPSPGSPVAITGVRTGLDNLHLPPEKRVIEFCKGRRHAAIIEILAMQIRGSMHYWKEQRLAGIEPAPAPSPLVGVITLFNITEDYSQAANSQCPDGSQGKECTYESGGKKYRGVCACANTNLKTNCICQKAETSPAKP